MVNKYLYFLLTLLPLFATAGTHDRLGDDILALNGWYHASPSEESLVLKKYFSDEKLLASMVFFHENSNAALVRVYSSFSAVKSIDNKKSCISQGVDFFFPNINAPKAITSSIKKLSSRTVYIDKVSNLNECSIRFGRQEYFLVKGDFGTSNLIDVLELYRHGQLLDLCDIKFNRETRIKVTDVEFYNSLDRVRGGNITFHTKGGQVFSVEFQTESGKSAISTCHRVLD